MIVKHYKQTSALGETCNLASEGDIKGIPSPNPLKTNNNPMSTTKIGIAF